MLKKILLIVTILSMLLLAGCDDDNEEVQLKNQVAQLEQQVADLKNGTESEPNTNNTSTGGVSMDAINQKLEAIKEPISKTIAAIDSAKPSADNKEKMDAYFQLKGELEAHERSLDIIDDELYQLYSRQEITNEAYKQLELAIDQLEDQIDQADDKLELIFGIDD